MKPLKKVLFCFAWILQLSCLCKVFAADDKIVEVSVRGNRRIETSAILNQVKTKAGLPYSRQIIRESIIRIYKLGFFDDIEVDSQKRDSGVHLTYIVHEKPTIRNIFYEGYKKVDLSDIKEQVDLATYAIVDLNKVKISKEKILKMYEQKGFFLARVSYSIKRYKKANEVDITFHIEELDKVKIRKINFIGNRVFSEDDLKSVMATKERGVLTWLTKSDNYQEEIFQGDLENIAYFYHTKGYVQVKVDPPVVTVSPEKKWIDIVLAVHEGESFRLGEVGYDGELIFSIKELEMDRHVLPDLIFNRDDLRKEVLRLADKYKDEGYAFANVNVKSNIREKDRKVDLTFQFEKGQKVYFGNINVYGNTNTRDKVIRRELLVHEGDLYNETRLRKSIEKIQALGYFSEVTHTKPQGEALNVLDLYIDLKERPTGALTVGAGLSGGDFVANAQISHNNLFGRGHNVSLNAQIAGESNRFSASFTEPYTFDSLWSSGFDAFKNETRTRDFVELKTGGDIRAGRPIGDYLSSFLTYKLEDIRLKEVAAEDLIKASGITSSILGTMIYDRRNNRFDPTKGLYDHLSTEYAGLGGDNDFFKSIFTSRFYFPVSFLKGVFRINAQAGFITRTTSTALPTTERFILGGVNSLRGFEAFTIGPKEISKEGKEVLVGGDREFFGNLEYEIPLVKEMGVKGVLFYDVGSAFDGSRIDDVRHDVGFGFRWFSPFGPIRVEIGFPINAKEGEKKQVVQFAITPPF